MPRSLFTKLHSLYGSPRSAAELAQAAEAGRQGLEARRLLPGALDSGALGDCDALPQTRVAVVGAGFAGLTAAWYLESAGAQVVVFEASERIGGRVETDRDLVPGKVVEAGAELIGENHPMWIELAAIFGLHLEPITTEFPNLHVQMRFGDRDLTDDEQKQLHADLVPVLDAIGQDAKDVDEVEPWTHPNAAALDGMSVSQRLDQLLPATSSLKRRALEFVLGNDNCAPVTRQSYLGLLALVSAGRTGDDEVGLRGYWESTETHRCAGGNDQLAASLAAGLADLRLDTPVLRITIADDSVGIAWGDPEGVGGSEQFDYVVLAAPPPSWPDVETVYTWDPSEWTMSHGPAVKHLNAFETEFWLDSGLAPNALWDQLGSVWEGTDTQPRSDPGFDLSVYSGGDFVLPEADYPLRLGEIFPGYAPVTVRFVDWPNRDWIGTGYSVPAQGEVTAIARYLASPFADLMLFAGEQSYVPFYGYMEGALQSGARAAREIVSAVCPDAVA
jgi:monoamine oxidase